jgi:3-hydroxyacyl-[acyl-carrier-protein] dehydratase
VLGQIERLLNDEGECIDSRLMRFQLIDQILAWTPGRSLQAVKHLTLAEEYLADHFPGFPVMPGVLMLETLVEAAAWLVRLTEDFRPTIVTLRDVKGAKYGTFMDSGHSMVVRVEVTGDYDVQASTVAFKGVGEKEGQQTVQARFVVSKRRVEECSPEGKGLDDQLSGHFRRLWATLRPDRAKFGFV